MTPAASPATQPPTVVGLLADPDLPADLAHHLVDVLPAALARVDSGRRWDVRVRVEPLVTANAEDVDAVMQVVSARLRQYGWDLAIGLTDLPRRAGTRAVVADLGTSDGVALASIPALGAVLVRRRALGVVVRLVQELVGTAEAARPVTWRRRALAREVGETVDRLVLHSRLGRWRMFGGMVRANRPWRLVGGLSGALLAAFATSAFGLFSANLWQLADALGVLRLSLTTAVSVAAMVVYLIWRHGLWERPAGVQQRRLARLYNAATVATLVIGVLVFYLALLLVMSLTVWFLMADSVLAQNLGHPTSWTDYLRVSWLITSAATVGGALGSGTEDGERVRRAAYGLRQRARVVHEADDGPRPSSGDPT
ncbi:MAG: rane protein [Modestobacter sp.]|jgi:hypothetical protein|nr:rane protein [Modestobacter sp.]